MTPSPSPAEFQGQALSRTKVGTKVLEMYVELLCRNDSTNVKKFARTVTNKVSLPGLHGCSHANDLKWLLHLLCDEEPLVVILTARVLARVLVINGSSYVDKFSDKTGGFIVMRHRLRRWWSFPAIWMVCFAILFGIDVALLDLQRPFDLYGMLASFPPGNVKAVYPGVLSVIIGLLQHGLKSVIRHQVNPNSPPARSNTDSPIPTTPQTRPRAKSLQVKANLSGRHHPDLYNVVD